MKPSFEQTVQNALQKWGVHNTSLVCAVSGGADSVALLLAIHALREALGLALAVCHVHHGIRGEEADRDAQFVKDLCDRLALPLHLVHAPVPAYAKAHKLGTEEAARILRYEALANVAGGAIIALAHTADDQVETVLFHLSRGTGLAGLCGMPARRGQLVRPLLGVTRNEVEAYLHTLGQTFCTDSTNGQTTYTRNALRHTVVPPLQDIVPHLARSVQRMTELLTQDADCLQLQAEDALHRATLSQTERQLVLDINVLNALHKAILSRVLRLAVSYLHPSLKDLTFAQMEAVQHILQAEHPSAQVHLHGYITARREYETLILEKKPDTIPALHPIPLILGAEPICWDNRLTVRAWHTDDCAKIYKKDTTFAFTCAKIEEATLCVRPRQTGDAIRLRHGGHTRTLKRLMIDQKIPANKRDRLAIVASDAGILFAEGLGADPNQQTNKGSAIIIEIEEKHPCNKI